MRKGIKRILALCLIIAITCALFSACASGQDDSTTSGETASQSTEAESSAEASSGDDSAAEESSSTVAGELPRNETIYSAQQLWVPPASFNVLSASPNFPVERGCMIMYEALFMYNGRISDMEPLLADSYEMRDDNTVVVHLNPNTHWNDGEALTAEDVVYTYQLGERYDIGWTNYTNYWTSVEAEDDTTIVINLDTENYNLLAVLASLQNIPIMPEHIWSAREEETGGDITKIREIFDEKPVASGAYMIDYYDDTKVQMIRDENYWGVERFGSLPAPKYYVSLIVESNDVANLMFQQGELDVTQAFVPNIWEYWEDMDLPVKTFYDYPPYYSPGVMPSLYFNSSVVGLDNTDVRRAIAYCIDYQTVTDVAVSGYSDLMIPSIVMMNTDEAKYINRDEVQDLEWSFDVDKANEILDGIGAERGADGIRVLPDGTRLGPYDLMCPSGWTDWQTALEMVAQYMQEIGIEARTNFVEKSIYDNARAVGDFDIYMDQIARSLNPAQPWERCQENMYSVGVAPIGEIAFRNYGRYQNDRADEIIETIPTITDETELRALYTELDQIYLTDIPNIALFYKPWYFYQVYEGVWEGFCDEQDGTDIPPQLLVWGAGIKNLYSITPVA